jgi:acyl carrier protein
MENKLKQIIAAVLGVGIEDIKHDSSSDTIENWDSLKQMNLVAAVEEEFGVEFDDEEIVLLNSYSLLLESLKNKLTL